MSNPQNQPLANDQWDQLLDVLSLGDFGSGAFSRYEDVLPQSWAYRIRTSVKRNLINRGCGSDAGFPKTTPCEGRPNVHKGRLKNNPLRRHPPASN